MNNPTRKTSTLLAALLLLIIPGCATPAQTQSTEQLAQTAADIALGAAGYGNAVPAANDLFGMAKQAQAGQPLADGALNQKLGTDVAAAIPANASPATKAAILQAAAALVQAQSPATGASIQGNRRAITFYDTPNQTGSGSNAASRCQVKQQPRGFNPLDAAASKRNGGFAVERHPQALVVRSATPLDAPSAAPHTVQGNPPQRLDVQHMPVLVGVNGELHYPVAP